MNNGSAPVSVDGNTAAARSQSSGKRKNETLHQIAKNYQLYLLLVLPLLYFFLFRYVPMAGSVIAFRRYVPGGSIFGEKWVGLRYFQMFINDPGFWNVFKNTIVLSVLNLVIGFPFPIIFALLLNEVDHMLTKRLVQTVSYLPRFFSTVVVVEIIVVLLNPTNGIVNRLIEHFGHSAIYFTNTSAYFRPIYILSDLWQFMGWNSILYIAALTNVDPQLYEVSEIDGAGRWKQTLHVTIPGIMPTIVITFILAVGHIMSLGFEKILLLYSPSIYDVADVIQTMTYRLGIVGNSYSYASAIGLFQALINLALIWAVNALARKIGETSLW